jgi:HEAT repeat protein
LSIVMQNVLFLVLALAGGFFGWELLLGPGLDVVRARSWTKTPCTIVESGLEASERTGLPRPVDPRGRFLHSLRVSFRYDVGGTEHVGRRYSFAANVRTERSRIRQRIVALYPTGREATCFVNPRDPAEAVINRRFQGEMLLGLAPLLLLVVGLGGLAQPLFEGRAAGRPRLPRRPRASKGAEAEKRLGEPWVNGWIAAAGFAGLALFGLLSAIGSEVSNLRFLTVHLVASVLLAVGYRLRSFAASALLAGYALLLSLGWIGAAVAPDGFSVLALFLGPGDPRVHRISELPSLAAAFAAEVSPLWLVPPAVAVLAALGARRLWADRPTRPAGTLALVVVVTAIPAVLVLDPSVRDVTRRLHVAGGPPTTESLLDGLGSGEPARVARACEAALGLQPPSPEVVTALVRAAEGSTGLTRASCLFPLQFAGAAGKPAEALLLSSLRDGDPHVLHAAAAVLGKLAPHVDASRAVPALVAAAPRADASARRTIATALGEFGPAAQAAVPALAGFVGDADTEVREAAVRSLGALGPLAAPATAALTRVVDDPASGHARRSAVEALGRVGPPARDAVPSLLRFHTAAAGSDDVRTAILAAACAIAPEAEEVVDLVARAVADPGLGSALAAVRGLGERGAPFVPRVAELLASPSAETRERALEVLGAIGPGAAVATPALARLAGSVDEADRNRALEALWKIGPGASEALPAVRSALSSSSDATRSSALYALARIAPASEEALREATKALVEADPGSYTARTAATSFEEIGAGGAPAVPRIVALLDSPSTDARENAVRALGGIGPPAAAALPRLRELAHSAGPQEGDLAQAVRKAIERIEAAPAGAPAGTPPAAP